MPIAYKYKDWSMKQKKEDKIVIIIGLVLTAIGLALIAVTFIRWYF